MSAPPPFSPSTFVNSYRQPGLDLLRVVAIGLVLLAHSEMLFEKHPLMPSPVYHFAGFLGVELFFALSGFLIGGLLWKRPLTNSRDLATFYARRWLRTLPAFMVAFTVLFLLYDPSAKVAIASLLFAGNLLPLPGYSPPSFFAVSWSLAIEEWFYLLLGLAFLLLGPSPRKFVIVWGGLVLFRTFWLASNPDAGYDVAHSVVVLRLDALLTGVLSAAFWARHATFVERYRIPLRLGASSVVLAFCLLWIAVPRVQYTQPIVFIFLLPVTSIALSAIVLSFASRTRGSDAPLRANPVIGFLAMVSYSLYLWHLELFFWVNSQGLSGSVGVFLAVGLSVGVATLSYYAVEVPGLKLRDRWFPVSKRTDGHPANPPISQAFTERVGRG